MVDLIGPGEILWEQYMVPMGIGQCELAAEIGEPVARLNGIICRREAITPDIAAKLAAFFQVSAQLFLDLQRGYETELARLDAAARRAA